MASKLPTTTTASHKTHATNAVDVITGNGGARHRHTFWENHTF